uniref:Uncharacterized protein n=1 Tax=Anguilla anguilla TaxID=7936 RepID=A0A0E9RLS2_ANGAN
MGPHSPCQHFPVLQSKVNRAQSEPKISTHWPPHPPVTPPNFTHACLRNVEEPFPNRDGIVTDWVSTRTISFSAR